MTVFSNCFYIYRIKFKKNNILSQKQNHKLSKALIENELANSNASKVPAVYVFEELDSTNQWLLDNISSAYDRSVLCVAECQKSGRGRAGRQWCSPSGSNVYMSFSRQVAGCRGNVSAVSLVIGLALVRVLKQKGVSGVSIKWPNDVLIDGRKLAGILIESKVVSGVLVLVVGVGINVQMPVNFVLNSEIGWADLSGKGVFLSDRNELIALFYIECQKMIDEFTNEGFSIFRNEWLSYDEFAAKEVKIVDRDQIIYSGIEMGVDDEGCLLVRSGAEIKRIFTGDVSLRIRNED